MNKEVDRLLTAKAKLLCHGVRKNRYSANLYGLQNPTGIGKSGLVGLHFLLGEACLPVLASTTYEFDRNSSFEVVKRAKGFEVQSDHSLTVPITPIPMPLWYQEKTTSGKEMFKVLTHEGTKFLHIQYSGCDLQKEHQGCRFCNAGTDWVIPTPKEIAETAVTSYSENHDYQLCLGGDTRLPLDENSSFFAKTAKLIRKRNNRIPIWVEMVPPETDDKIEEMIDAGVTAFGFNLKVWSNFSRSRFCPGKSQISKKRYLEAMQFVQKRLGSDCINTALIAGLEPFKSTLQGITALSAMGIEITLLPFRPWDKAELARAIPSDPGKYMKLSYILAEEMRKNGIYPEEHFGCANCPSCTLEGDILKYVPTRQVGS